MHSTNTIYNQLLAAGAKVEYKLKLNGVDYGCPPVRSMSAVYQAFSEDMPTVGCCIGAQLDVVMDIPSATIPKGAQLTPYARLNNGTQQSGWIAKKTYWISTRDDRSITGRMKIKAFDAMGKTEQSFLTGGDVGLWPQTDIDVVDEICERIGVTLDNGTRSILTAGYDIPLPAELTMREVLGRIGTFYWRQLGDHRRQHAAAFAAGAGAVRYRRQRDGGEPVYHGADTAGVQHGAGLRVGSDDL